MKKLLNPLAYYPEKLLLFINLGFFAAGTFIAIMLRAWFDNTFHLSFRTDVDALKTFTENSFSVILVALAFFIAGKIFNNKVRFVDCLNLSFYIRIPFYLMALSNFNGTLSNMTENSLNEDVLAIKLPTSNLDISILIISSIISLAIIVFQFFVIYKGFKTLSNAKKISHYLIMVVFLILTMILSTILFKYF